jgi:hypothetical protein
MQKILTLLVLALAAPIIAAPALIEITTIGIGNDGTGGPAEYYNLHRGCNLQTQTVGDLIAERVETGEIYSFQGDTNETYFICVVAVNEAGQGGFNIVRELTGPLLPPGLSFISLTYEFIPN